MRVLMLLAVWCCVAGLALAQEPTTTDDREALQQKLAQRDRLQKEIDELKASAGIVDQMLVKISIIEISLTKAGPLGFDPQTFTLRDKPIVIDTEAPTTDSQVQRVFAHDIVIKTLEALRKRNVAKVLVEPNLVVADGQPATFFVGGRFPYPLVRDDGKQSTEFRPFGTQVDAVARSLGNNRVQMEFRATVSHLNEGLSIIVGDQKVPGVTEETVDTACELKLGQTLVLAGNLCMRVEAHRVRLSPDDKDFTDVEKYNVVQQYHLVTVHRMETTKAEVETAKAPAESPK